MKLKSWIDWPDLEQILTEMKEGGSEYTLKDGAPDYKKEFELWKKSKKTYR